MLSLAFFVNLPVCSQTSGLVPDYRLRLVIKFRNMTNKINKTNAARLLDKAGVSYELIPYVVDEEDLAATHIAQQLGEPIERVFKTLVLKGDRSGHFVCVVPGDSMKMDDFPAWLNTQEVEKTIKREGNLFEAFKDS